MKSARIIQLYAYIIGGIGILTSLVCGIVFIVRELYLYGFLILVGGIFGSLVTGAFIYGFGLIIENTTAIREMMANKTEKEQGDTIDLTNESPEEKQ